MSKKVLIFTLLFFLICATPAVGQFDHFGGQGASETLSETIVESESSQPDGAITTLAELQELVNAAAEKAREWNMTFTVTVPDGSIIRGQPEEVLVIPSHVFVTSESGKTRTWRLIFQKPPPDSVLIQFQGDSYGAGLAGCDIRVNPYDAPNITGIRTDFKTKNATIEHVRFEHRGMDALGLHVRGHESLTVQKCEFRCSVPVVLNGGDNHVFRDMDIGTAVTEEMRAQFHSGLLPCTCIWVKSMPFHITFDGSQTWQGGDFAVFGIVDSKTSGQSLTLYNVRYEQTLSRASEEFRAVYLKFMDRHLERLSMYSCRWTDRAKGFYIVGCLNVEYIGCWIPGTKYWRREP